MLRSNRSSSARRKEKDKEESGQSFSKIFLSISLILIAIGSLYVYNLDGWLIHDDEGTHLYEAWRVSEGDVPGVDLITEQPPLFLLGGVLAGRLSDFNILALRGVTVALALLAGWPVFLIGNEVWGERVGLLGLVLYLINHMTYATTRLYMPDVWMLSFAILGIYLFILSQTRKRRGLLPLASVAFALSTLSKLFGVLSLGGCLLFLAYQALSRRATLRHTLGDGLLLILPFLLITPTAFLAFYPPSSAYYDSVLGHHWQQGREASLLSRVGKGFLALGTFFYMNLSFLFTLPFLPRLGTSGRPGERILAWQTPTAFTFFLLSRNLWPRYWLYLIPAFALILAYLIDRALNWLASRATPRTRPLIALASVGIILLALLQSAPRIFYRARLYDEDTRELAAYIAEQTAPDDTVLADYATLNFYARRPSVYQASIIATGRIQSGLVTGAELIREMEQRDVQTVLHHVPGGTNPPSHLVFLRDYDTFYTYLNTHYCMVRTFYRAGQLFEIYQICP